MGFSKLTNYKALALCPDIHAPSDGQIAKSKEVNVLCDETLAARIRRAPGPLPGLEEHLSTDSIAD